MGNTAAWLLASVISPSIEWMTAMFPENSPPADMLARRVKEDKDLGPTDASGSEDRGERF
jgi:hypothetical protein